MIEGEIVIMKVHRKRHPLSLTHSDFGEMLHTVMFPDKVRVVFQGQRKGAVLLPSWLHDVFFFSGVFDYYYSMRGGV